MGFAPVHDIKATIHDFLGVGAVGDMGDGGRLQQSRREACDGWWKADPGRRSVRDRDDRRRGADAAAAAAVATQATATEKPAAKTKAAAKAKAARRPRRSARRPRRCRRRNLLCRRSAAALGVRAVDRSPAAERASPRHRRRGASSIEKSVRDRLLPARIATTASAPRSAASCRSSSCGSAGASWRCAIAPTSSTSSGAIPTSRRASIRCSSSSTSTYFRVETRGLGHIPDDGRALIVANHSGTLPYDGAMIMHAVSRSIARSARCGRSSRTSCSTSRTSGR